MSVIGIIDDDKNDIGTLKRTILSILKKNNIDICIEFKEYDLSSNRGEISDEIVKEILNDIINYQISILIIDHKIIIKDKLLSGAEIFEKIRKVAPDFPTIIMTNVVDDSKKNNYVDPDKVYAKSEFFKIGNYAKEKTENIIKNIERYNELRNNTQEELNKLKEELISDSENQNIVNMIVEKERELDKYLPLQRSYLEDVINLEEIKEILNLIKDANNLLE